MQHSQRWKSPVEGTESRRESAAAQEPKRVYLRTTYALNPGIPHYLDFPIPGK